MKTIIKYLQFPFAFSAEQLQAELNGLNAQWVAHFHRDDYDGDWCALPLRSLNASLTDLIPESRSGAIFQDTILMDQCPYMKSILGYFPCEINSVRLLNLKPGAVIKEHRDGGLGYERGEARIHVPVMTNPQVEFYLDNERIDVQPGECWYMNFDLLHRINNFGTTDRVHLVIDLIVNDAIREMFEQVDAAKKKMIPDPKAFSSSEIENIVRSLKEMNTPVSLKLASEMEAGIV